MASSTRIEELERKFNENPRRYFAPLANEYRKAGDLEQAIAICRTYVPQQPAHMSGHIVFGQALFEAGEHEEARGVFEAALALDPENLIALRHLGDIARERGEVSAARAWYQRVLDADPRNEEVVTLLAAFDGAPARPAPDMPTWAEINPERTLELPPGILETATRETVLGPAAGSAAPGIPAPGSGIADTLQPPPPGVPRAGWARDTPARADDVLEPGFVDLAPINIVGAKPDVPPAVAREETPSPAPADAAHAAAITGTPFLDLEHHDAAPPASERAADPAPVGGLESMEFVAPARAEVSPPTHASEAGRPSGDETPAVFVTETMAELYLQQGFRDEALNVYRQLLAQNPNDAALRSRVEHLEGGASSSVADAAAVDVGMPSQSSAPLSVRAFFAALAARSWNGTSVDLAPPVPADMHGEASDDFAEEIEQPSEPPAQEPEVAATEPEPEPEAVAAVAEAPAIDEVPSADPPPAPSVVETHDVSTEAPRDGGASPASAHTDADPGYKLDIDPLSHDERPSASTRVMDEFGYTGITSIVAGGSEYDVASYDAADMSGSMERIPPPAAAPLEPVPSPTSSEAPVSAPAPAAIASADAPQDHHAIEATDVNGSAPEPPVRKPMQTGSVNVLFPQQSVQASDETAASTLSNAFGGPSPSVTAGQGHPARPAANELSLDNIFRESAPRPELRREPSAFSFDQFFTDNAPPTRASPSPSGPSSGPPTTPEEPSQDTHHDAEQFSNWLSGLKKK